MSLKYLHNHSQFGELLRIVGEREGIDDVLVEKDYWIMHCLFGLKGQGRAFQLKGGTSLSKGFQLIHRFSEDIDIRIEPLDSETVYTGPNHQKTKHCESRREYYDSLAASIKIDGVTELVRDPAFDDSKYRSGGIRVHYPTALNKKYAADIKEGILLEVGFDDIAPNDPLTISSWAYDYAKGKVDIIDNRAIGVPCYNPGYTLVEKLQTISTKFRIQQEKGEFSSNFMRHYYDVYCLLGDPSILGFLSTDEYTGHKKLRFRKGDNPCIRENSAFSMENPAIFKLYEQQYEMSKSLYYREKPTFREILDRIKISFDIL